jgi:hypothetical protein
MGTGASYREENRRRTGLKVSVMNLILRLCLEYFIDISNIIDFSML